MIHVIGFMIGFYVLARSVEMFKRNSSGSVRVLAGLTAIVALLGISVLVAMAIMGPPEPTSQIFFSR